MRSWIKRLLFIFSVLLCQSCIGFFLTAGLIGDCAVTRFLLRNITDEVIVLEWDSGIRNDEYGPPPSPVVHRLSPGDTVQVVYSNGSHGDFLSIHAISNCKLSLSTEDGALLRYWAKYDDPDDLEEALEGCHASYFKDSVRQLHDEKEWTITKEEKEWVYLFDILPEDLVPLHEIAGEKEQ